MASLEVSFVMQARALAFGAHAGQTDKAGNPYIEHVARVALRGQTLEEQTLGWLHDVVEDTPLECGDLTMVGFLPSIVARVDALTHRKGEPRVDYYERILQFPAAVQVKLYDIEDNSDPARLALLPLEDQERLRAKYAKARDYLLGRTGA